MHVATSILPTSFLESESKLLAMNLKSSVNCNSLVIGFISPEGGFVFAYNNFNVEVDIPLPVLSDHADGSGIELLS